MGKKLRTRGDRGSEKGHFWSSFPNPGLPTEPSCAPSASLTPKCDHMCVQALCVHVFVRSHDPSGDLSLTSQPTAQHLIRPRTLTSTSDWATHTRKVPGPGQETGRNRCRHQLVVVVSADRS